MMKPRSVTARYQTAARIWFTLAGLSLLLPPADRRGLWLPLHLALAGAASTAISGAMQNFMLALTATPSPPAWITNAQFGLVVGGTAAIAIGMPTGTPWLVGAGGAAFVAAMAILGWMLRRAWRRALNLRHVLPMAAYAAAVLAVLIGGTLGALMGSGVVTGATYIHFQRAHMTMNVLGFVSLTIVGTLVTLLPTALRVRMPPWRGRSVLGLFVGGLLLQLAGWDLAFTPVLAAGGIAYAAGALGLAWFVISVLRIQRRWRPPLAALHMVASAAWFVWGSLGLAWALIHGPAGFDAYRTTFLVAFVGGWVLQVLLGAWAYLLPMARPGHPDERRRMLAAFELAAPIQLVALNGGLALLALRGAGWVGPGAGDLAVVLTAAGATMALAKAWLFPLLGLGPVDTARARAVWGS
jgi:nitrite reductase (NO-forming)